MQAKDAMEKWRKWNEKGNKPCSHPHFEKEYYLGTHTGDYVCTNCGEPFTKQEIDELHKPNKP